jgi:hypothetical protein
MPPRTICPHDGAELRLSAQPFLRGILTSDYYHSSFQPPTHIHIHGDDFDANHSELSSAKNHPASLPHRKALQTTPLVARWTR